MGDNLVVVFPFGNKHQKNVDNFFVFWCIFHFFLVLSPYQFVFAECYKKKKCK
jgi:hypothetical protein